MFRSYKKIRRYLLALLESVCSEILIGATSAGVGALIGPRIVSNISLHTAMLGSTMNSMKPETKHSRINESPI